APCRTPPRTGSPCSSASGPPETRPRHASTRLGARVRGTSGDEDLRTMRGPQRRPPASRDKKGDPEGSPSCSQARNETEVLLPARSLLLQLRDHLRVDLDVQLLELLVQDFGRSAHHEVLRALVHG